MSKNGFILSDKVISNIDEIAGMFPKRLRVTIISFFALFPVMFVVGLLCSEVRTALGYTAFYDTTAEESPYYTIREDSTGYGLWSEKRKEYVIKPENHFMNVEYNAGLTLVEIFPTKAHFESMVRNHKLFDEAGHQLLKNDLTTKKKVRLFNQKFLRYGNLFDEDISYLYLDGTTVSVIDNLMLNFRIGYFGLVFSMLVIACVMGTWLPPTEYKLL